MTAADRLDGDVVVVTGAAGGVGLALAQEAAARGARVVIADIVEAAAAEAVGTITAAGGTALSCRTDVSDYASVVELLAFVEAQVGGVNVLVNNAIAGAGAAPLDVADPALTKTLFDVGILGSFHTIRAFASALKGQAAQGRHAFVLNVGSEHSLGVPPHVMPLSTYTVSKYAMLGLTDTARRDLAGSGVGVALLAPGWVRTAQVRQYIASSPEAAAAIDPLAQDPDEVARLAFDGLLAGHHIIATNPVSRAFAIEQARAVITEVERLPAAAPVG